MKFGKLSNIEDVNFTIPDLQFVNSDISHTPELNIYLGTTGWSNKEWNGSFYPKGTKSSEFLSEYGNLFNTIELNSTHYHIPSEERVRTWKSKVQEGFTFCPKVPQDISHRSNIASETSQTNTFFRSIKGFGETLGTCFMQLPVYFAPQQTEQLLHFLARKPKEIKFAIELRHKDWFANGSQQLKILADQLTRANTAIVVTDVSGRRDVCHGILPNETLMVRFVGSCLHDSDYSRMDQWVAQIKHHQAQLKDVYIFFHQPTMDDIPQMANYFIEQLEKVGLKSPIPSLKAKFQADIQLKLF